MRPYIRTNGNDVVEYFGDLRDVVVGHGREILLGKRLDERLFVTQRTLVGVEFFLVVGPPDFGRRKPWSIEVKVTLDSGRRYLAALVRLAPEGIGPDFAAIPPGDRNSESCKRLPLLIQTRIGPAAAGVVRACARTRPEAARNLPGSPWRPV